MRVRIYLDEGVDAPLFKQVVKEVRRALPAGSVVRPADRTFFTSENWERGVDLIIIPGGRDVPYHDNLQGEANRRIRQFVLDGGRYLGICAGAYYGSSHVVFEEGGELEVVAPRELAFFPGRAVGPAYGKGLFRYDSQQGVRSASLKWNEKVVNVYYNGGCLFEGADRHDNVEILAHYDDIEGNPPAIIECEVGKGKAILSGVHFEHALEEAHEPQRFELMKSLLKRIFALNLDAPSAL
ncbi:MAG: hypothetical protein H7A36_06995 [Chlamydiales bacterium]|nr:hypothetical protein [Chlamydiales bacterium]